MSAQVLPVTFDCNGDCPDLGTAAIPGPQGEAGTDGSDGSNGVSAFTFVASDAPGAQPTMPAEGANVTVNTTTSTAFLQPNAYVFVAFWGTMKVFNVVSASQLVLQNPENTAAGLYPENAAPGTSLPAGSRITIAGQQGSSGAAAAGGLLAANNLSDVGNVATSRSNLGLGDAAQGTLGTADTNVVQVDDAAGLTAGNALLATATGIESPTDATFRTAIGLGTIATQDANAVNIDGGTIDGTPIGGSTPAAVAATTLAASGATSLGGSLTASSTLFTPSSAIQTVAAANTISPNAAKIRVAGSGGAVTLTSTPTITTPAADGQRLVIMGTDNTNTVTLQDESNFAGSKLRLAGGNDVVLGLYDTLELIWDSTTGFWTQLSASNN